MHRNLPVDRTGYVPMQDWHQIFDRNIQTPRGHARVKEFTTRFGGCVHSIVVNAGVREIIEDVTEMSERQLDIWEREWMIDRTHVAMDIASGSAREGRLIQQHSPPRSLTIIVKEDIWQRRANGENVEFTAADVRLVERSPRSIKAMQRTLALPEDAATRRELVAQLEEDERIARRNAARRDRLGCGVMRAPRQGGGGGGGGRRGRRRRRRQHDNQGGNGVDSDEDESAEPPPVMSDRQIREAPPLPQTEMAEQLMENLILPRFLPQLYFGQPTRNVLMFGPPGTGKTRIARSLLRAAREKIFNNLEDHRFNMFVVSAAHLIGGVVGLTEQRIQRLYEVAEEVAEEEQDREVPNQQQTGVHGLSLVFLDEVESVAPDRSQMEPGGSAKGEQQSTNQLLIALDGARSFPHVVTLAASNVPWRMDPAILSRFKLQLFVDYGNDDDRYNAIVAMLNKHTKCSHDCRMLEEQIERIVEATGFGRDAPRRIAKYFSQHGANSMYTTTEYWKDRLNNDGRELFENSAGVFGTSFRVMRSTVHKWLTRVATKKATTPVAAWPEPDDYDVKDEEEDEEEEETRLEQNRRVQREIIGDPPDDHCVLICDDRDDDCVVCDRISKDHENGGVILTEVDLMHWADTLDDVLVTVQNDVNVEEYLAVLFYSVEERQP